MSGSQSNLGEIVIVTQVITSGPSSHDVRKVILLLAASVALMMTGFGIIMPVFARRLGEFGSGVEALGLMTMSFALAQLVASPFMGSLADGMGDAPWCSWHWVPLRRPTSGSCLLNLQRSSWQCVPWKAL